MRPRWLIAALIASVALNVFLVGAGGGLLAFGAQLVRSNPGARPAALFWATQGLPQPDRRQMRQMLRGLRAQVKPDSARSLALRAAAWSALAGPKPDAAAIKQQLAQSRQLDIGVRATVEEKLVDYAAALPLADRAIFAAGMKRQLPPPPKP